MLTNLPNFLVTNHKRQVSPPMNTVSYQIISELSFVLLYLYLVLSKDSSTYKHKIVNNQNGMTTYYVPGSTAGFRAMAVTRVSTLKEEM